jgi:hypothetical protein
VERIMCKAKKQFCRKHTPKKLPQHPVMQRAYEAGKGLGISNDAGKPAWEKKYEREIILKADL